MNTIDQFLLNLFDKHEAALATTMPKRSFNILSSLKRTVESPLFVTENQSNLLLKILRENSTHISKIVEDFDNQIKAPTWSKPFRPIERVKKFFISTSNSDFPVLVIESSFSASLRKLLLNNSKNISNLIQVLNGKLYHAELNEQNIVFLVDLLDKLEFEIDEKIIEHYNIIKSWNFEEISQKFIMENMPNQKFYDHIVADLGRDNLIDRHIVVDRSMRYQYRIPKQLGPYNSLVERIANRESTKIWIGRSQHTLHELFLALKQLQRLPALVVFDTWESKRSTLELKNLIKSMADSGISGPVGIYFRLSNDDAGKEFNQLISTHNLNAELNKDAIIAGVQSGKIPKFFIKNEWKPMSIISIGNTLKHSKTAIYANKCDLVISYTDFEPMIEARNIWE